METEKTIAALAELGFRNEWDGMTFPYGEYYDECMSKVVKLKGDGIYAYTVGSVPGEDYLEMHLNFIPEEADLLKTLLTRVFYLS